MRIVGKNPDDFHAGLDLGVGLIDDAERRLATRHQDEGGANVLDHGDFLLDGRPHAELFQSGLGVKPDWNRAHVAGRDAAVAGQSGEIEARPDRHVADLGILRRDEHQPIAEQIDPRVVLYDFLL